MGDVFAGPIGIEHSISDHTKAISKSAFGARMKPSSISYGYIKFNRTGLSHEGRPIGNFLFLGPTGSGKTRVVELLH
jgi:hypothetical protein